MELFKNLTATSTPEEIAAAYQQYAGMSGGDTQAVQTQAMDYLTNLGIAAPTIQQAYGQYLKPPAVVSPLNMQSTTPAVVGTSAVVPATTAAAPLSVEGLYQQYAGRASDPEGLQYWTQRFGDTIDPDEVSIFQGTLAYDLARAAAKPPATVQPPTEVQPAAKTVVPAVTSNTAATALNQNHVVALGDSTTWGYNAGNQLGTNMVSSAQNALGSNYTIDNLGTNSTTIGDLLSNAGGNNNWANTLAGDAGVVVLNYGLNEAYRGEDPATFAANLTKAVNDLKAAGKSVILQTPNIATGYDWAGNVSKYADAIRGVASATGSSLDDKYATTSGMANFFDPATGDTIHPSSAAYATLGGNLANVISGLNKTSQTGAATAPLTVEDLYQQYAGRASDPGGLQYWTRQFGDTIDPNEVQTFRDTHAYNLAQEAATASGDPRRKGIVEAIDRQEPGTQPSVIPQSTIGAAPLERSPLGSRVQSTTQPNLENNALDRLTRERRDLYEQFFKPNEGVIDPFEGGYTTNFASFDEYNTENPIERDVSYQLIKDGVYDYKNATTEQLLRARKRLDNPNIVFDENTNLSRDAFLKQIDFLDLWNYKNNFEGKNAAGSNKPLYSSYAEYKRANPLENNATYKAIQSGEINYENAEPDEQFNKIRNPRSPGVVTSNITKEDAISRLERERLNFYRDNLQGKYSADGTPGFASYEEYLQYNPIERDPKYQLIQSGVLDYRNATPAQRNRISNPEDQLIRDAYGSIGRTGIGTEASQIDQAGYDYWSNALKTGQIKPEEFQQKFRDTAADYLVRNPEDKYSTYTTDFLSRTKPDAVAGVVDLYRNVLGRDPSAAELGGSYKQFGTEISPAERANFEQSFQTEINPTVQDLYTQYMGAGRVADQGGIDYWNQRFGPSIDKDEKEQFRQAAAAELSGKFGAGDVGLLDGYKYAKSLGVSNKGLEKTLGKDLYNQYQGQLKNFATTNINNIVSDSSLSFEESQQVANFARDLGFNSQQLADLTGKNKSLFDTILTNYGTNRDRIINETLAGPNILTDADRIVAAYALERQFGFTDDDLAKATGRGVAEVKGLLDPVRNFETDFSKIANNTDSTTQQLKDFVLNARSNSAIDKLYGTALTGYEDRIAGLEQKWSRWGTDAVQSENLFQQLDAQRNAIGGQYFQGAFGDLEYAAARMVLLGLDTVSDLGKKDKFQTTAAQFQYTTAGGMPLTEFNDGTFGYVVPAGDGGEWQMVPRDQVKTIYGTYVPGSDPNDPYSFTPLTETELATLKDGSFQQKTGSVVIDKDTGRELTDTTGELAFQKSGGHLTGRDHFLKAKFAEDGTPYLIASTEKTGLYEFISDVGPMIVSIAAMIPGPHQPFAMAANAALALEQKNYLGAVLSGLGAYGTFTGNELTALNAAEKSGDVINASRALDLQNTASNIKLAQTAVGGFAALQQENLPGLINAGLSAYGQIGGTLPSGVTTALQAANLAAAITSDNIPAALTALGDLTGSKDMYVAAAAKNLVDALQSGNPVNIAQAGMGFANSFQAANQAPPINTGGITNRVVDDAISQGNAANELEGTNALDTSGSAAFIAAKNAGATDAEALDAANTVTGAATGVQVNPIDAGGPNLSTVTNLNPPVAIADTEFGDLQGAIETNAMGDAVRTDKLNSISQAPKFNDAYSQARELLGPNQTFTWNGRQYSTATAAERPDLSAPAIRPAPPVQPATDQSAAETGRLTSRNTELANAFQATQSTGFFKNLYNDLNNQFKLQGEGAVEYLRNNPNSPITNSVSTALEAAGELSKNVVGGMALFFNNKPLSDAVVKGGNDLINLGQSVGDGPQDTKNWNDTMNLVDKASGWEKLGVMAGRLMDGTTGLGRQVAVELRQELPALFLGGGSVKGILLASGLVDTTDTGGNAVLDAYQQNIDKGGSHESALAAGRTAGATAAATEAVIQATLGKLGDLAAGKLDNLVAKGATKSTSEAIVEGVQEGGAGAAVDVALGNALDLNKYLTQGVAGAAVGKGTAVATSGSDAAQSGAPNQAAPTTGTPGTSATDLGAIGATQPGAAVVTGADLGAVGSVTPGADLAVGAQDAISVADAQQVMGDLGLNVSDDAAVSLATKIEAANSSGNDVSITSDGNTVAIIDATENTQTTVDANTGTTTVVDENTNTTTQTAVDADTKTQTSVVVDANNNTTTQTIVNDQTNVTTSITVNLNTDITTKTENNTATNTQTTVVTDTNTNTQTTIKVNTSNGDVVNKKETTIPDSWKPPVIKPPVVPPVPKPPTVTPPKAPAAPAKPAPAPPKLTPKPSDGVIAGAGMIGLPLGINVDPASLRSQVTGGAIDPLARVKAAQAELEREVMMNQMDPRFLAAIQQRMDPQQQTKQFDDDIGALSKLLRGEPEAPANEGQYYSYGSEDSIDNILGGKAANYKEGGFVEPLKASGGMVLPLLAKSGGALGHYKGREDFKNGKHVAGEGDGQSDDIPAWLADGEFVVPSDVVSALGNGSSKAGTDKLYEMMHEIRERARSTGPKDLPPPALKSPLDYMKKVNKK